MEITNLSDETVELYDRDMNPGDSYKFDFDDEDVFSTEDNSIQIINGKLKIRTEEYYLTVDMKTRKMIIHDWNYDWILPKN